MSCDLDRQEGAVSRCGMTEQTICFRVADVDECATGTAKCDPNATCSNLPPPYICTCDTTRGYIGDGFSCTGMLAREYLQGSSWIHTSCNTHDLALQIVALVSPLTLVSYDVDGQTSRVQYHVPTRVTSIQLSAGSARVQALSTTGYQEKYPYSL